jgi:hypothetical protein
VLRAVCSVWCWATEKELLRLYRIY